VSNPAEWGAKPVEPDGPAAWGATSADSKPKNTDPDFWDWLRTRGQRAATGVLGAPRAAADINEQALQWVGEQLGAPETGKTAGKVARFLIPGQGLAPSAEEMRDYVNRKTGWQDTNAPESWGVAGKVADVGTEAALGSLLMPAGGVSQVARNVIPAAIGGGASELAGEVAKGTRWELPARIAAALFGGVGGAAAQNTVVAPAVRGVVNTALANTYNPERAAARVLGRALQSDETTMPGLLAAHGEHLPGTPLAAVGGENVRGAVRGAYTMRGPGREIIEEGAERFRDTSASRVAPVLDRISPLPPAEARAAQLAEGRGAASPPAYRAAGVADDPQTVLTTRPGAPVPSPSTILGPDGQPMTVMRPGAPVTTATTNSPVLQSPALSEYLGQSRDIQTAIRQARGLPDFRDLPETSMTMLDKVYKNLGGKESAARRAGDGEPERDIGRVRRELLGHIDAENPQYSAALLTYAEPSRLIDAARLGETLMGQTGLPPSEMARQFRALATDAERREFLGGAAGWMRNKSGSTDRATSAERFWNSDYTRGKIQELFPTVTAEGPSNAYHQINQALQNERQAARNLRDITKGSPTQKIGQDIQENLGEAGLLADMAHRGVVRGLYEGASRAAGRMAGRAAEGRTRDMNAALARMAMQHDPAEIIRTQGLVETARQRAAAADAGRAGSYAAAPAAGLLNSAPQAAAGATQQPDLIGRIMQGLLGGR